MRHLLCGDEASNNGNWQWIASVGVDPAPPFRRMYNPMTQQRRHDPDGEYVRRWVPELRAVPLAQARRAVDDERGRAARGRLRDRRGLPGAGGRSQARAASGRWPATAPCAAERPRRRRAAWPALPAARSAPGRPAPPAHRGAHAPRRAGGELLVPAPPRRLRVDRLAGRRPARGRPRLRRGLRLGGARPHGGLRRGGRRQPRGLRARRPQVHGPQAALRAQHARAVGGRRRLRRVPADHRARPGPRRRARRGCGRWSDRTASPTSRRPTC